jgi:hypothetical protein
MGAETSTPKLLRVGATPVRAGEMRASELHTPRRGMHPPNLLWPLHKGCEARKGKR